MECVYKNGSSEVTILTQPDDVEALLVLFHDVAQELGWEPGNWLTCSPERSIHFVAREAGALAGGLQLVFPDSMGQLPCQAVWPEVEIPAGTSIAHLTILALSSAYRGHPGLFWTLCVELWRYCVCRNVTALLLECTPPMLRLYRRLGWPLEVIGTLRPHWGEDCYLCRLDTCLVAGSLLMKAVRCQTYRLLIQQACRA